MKKRVNPPAPQLGPIAFAGVCFVGVAYSLPLLLSMRYGSQPWQVGLLLLVTVLAGFAFIVGGWLAIQREVDFVDGQMTIRRWIEVVSGRPGETYPLDGRTTAAIVLQNVRSLFISRDGVVVNKLTLGYWQARPIRDLVDALRANDVALDGYWEGEYPPGTG